MSSRSLSTASQSSRDLALSVADTGSRASSALWASLGLDPTYIGCYFWSNNESRDSIDCFYGCLEGPSIFLESFIFLRVLICACREGEIVAVMA